MRFPLKDVYEAYEKEQGNLPERVLTIMQSADEGMTAEAVAGMLVGSTGRYRVIMDPKVQELVPAVTEILEVYVIQKKLIKATMDCGAEGKRVAFAKLPPAKL